MKKTKNLINVKIAKNSFSAKEDGTIVFNKPLVITDNNEQWNGTKYDIASMDIEGFGNKLTANHSGQIQEVLGLVFGTRKVANKKVVIDSIKFAIEENALALYAYKMMTAKDGPYLTDFSIETVGQWPDEEGVYYNSSLVGLSLVVVGNNKSAKINEIATNSIQEAKDMGLDASVVENNFVCYDNNVDKINQEIKKENKELNDMKFVTIKNNRKFEIAVKFKNAAGDEVEKNLASGETVDVSDDQKEAVEKQISDAQEPVVDQSEAIKEAIKSELSNVVKELNDLKKQIFDKGAKEPEFKAGKSNNEVSDMDYRDRHGKQILAAWNYLKKGSTDALKTLNEINKYNLEKLQEKELVRNTITIEDMGSFVISPELLSDIEGHRSNFRPLLDKVTYQETLSTQMAWLKRNGDVNMQEVEMCDDGVDGNLKPISEYSADIKTSNLQELAAVTPVCNAATRFLAADLLGDVAQGYRTDYDRKLAQLVMARLQQSVDETGNKNVYNKATGAAALKSWIAMWQTLTEEVENGVFIFNYKTKGQLLQDAVDAGISGDILGMLQKGDFSPILGAPSIIVPNELMPALNTADSKTFTVEGSSVSIDQAVFFADLSSFSGRVSGGLQYDFSTDAAYEDNGTVKSAFQRNELVMRGSFFRGGKMRDASKVASLNAAGVS